MPRRSVAFSSVALCLLAGSLAGPPAAAANTASGPATYTYVNLGWLGSLPVGRPWSEAWDVNAARQVVGSGSNTVNPAGHAFTWQNGQLTALPAIYAPGENVAASINDAGDVAGHTHVNRTDPPHAFIRRNGSTIDLGTGWGSGSGSAAKAINNQGVVVGTRFQYQGGPVRAVLWSASGRLRDLGTLGGSSDRPWSTESEAHAVNDKGQVVGTALARSGPALHGFLWEDGRMTDLGSLGGTTEATVARGINEKTQITGSSQNAAGEIHAFMWDLGVMRDLGVLPGGTSSFAYDINESGHVVGTSRTSADYYGAHAFVWEGERMVDLNTVVTNLPSDVALEHAFAINDDGVIVGSTCYYCEPGKTADQHAYMLIPNG
ncbi:DUF3466 family protein [Nonomuraea jiangxiensis]|uniref:Probable extracellular repeat, HAF family n=1 Tax=Nonomuraea jiangxiensis TaxID=633440 RepID=A0A1G8Q6R9_9ACTN|nr:DUF3466 family protein [Nonomuraea jiangxiensis]SDJ00454.1 probable extracellular repeat, HAF family [Nonomuraea jiangxiensis]